MKYQVVLFNVRVNQKRVAKLENAGLKLNERTRAQTEALNDRHLKAAPNPERAITRAHSDKAGNQIVNNGTPLFTGWAGSKHEAMCLAKIREDLAAAGYVLVSINMVQKQGDNGAKLFVRFEPVADGVVGFQTWPQLERQLDIVFGNVYSTLHGYRNPDGTATVNPSEAIPSDHLAGKEVRMLRMKPDCSFRFVKAQVVAQQPAPAPKPVDIRAELASPQKDGSFVMPPRRADLHA